MARIARLSTGMLGRRAPARPGRSFNWAVIPTGYGGASARTPGAFAGGLPRGNLGAEAAPCEPEQLPLAFAALLER
jgi:hypothetical protein